MPAGAGSLASGPRRSEPAPPARACGGTRKDPGRGARAEGAGPAEPKGPNRPGGPCDPSKPGERAGRTGDLSGSRDRGRRAGQPSVPGDRAPRTGRASRGGRADTGRAEGAGPAGRAESAGPRFPFGVSLRFPFPLSLSPGLCPRFESPSAIGVCRRDRSLPPRWQSLAVIALSRHDGSLSP